MRRGATFDFASEEYLRLKAIWKGIPYRRTRRSGAKDLGGSQPYDRGRDPKALGDVLSGVADSFGWTHSLSQALLIEEWPNLVGEAIAGHTEVVSITDSTLVVRCDSTAWTTELRRLRAEIVTKIGESYPESQVTDIRFLAPGAPSWRHGARSVPGRGPRDTYG